MLSIGVYTLGTWGEAQTIRYIDELEGCCRHLADSCMSGRACDYIRPGLYRMEVGKDIIFFQREPAGILISRVLHERMLPERHAYDGDDEVGSD